MNVLPCTLAAVQRPLRVSFTMEAPFFSTIKAFFLLSLVPAVGVFSGLGLEQAAQGLGRMRWLLYANLALLAGAVLCLFAY